MSFPFVFKPIKINGVLAYDGGLYNNFPVDVMINELKPDIIIGSVVAPEQMKAEENDLLGQINNMIVDRTDYTLPDSLGILMTFDYDDVGLLDFQKLEELHDTGYRHTMILMDSIKGRIQRRVDADSIRSKRVAYRNTLPELRFKQIYTQGANSYQQEYIKKEFRKGANDEFTYEDLKWGYFRLLSDNAFSEIIPRAKYNPEEKVYDLYLDVTVRNGGSFHFGGGISTTSSNQIYLGVGYQSLNYYLKEFFIDGQMGKVYNNFQLMAKIDFNTDMPKSFRLITSLSSFDYFKKEQLFNRNFKPAFVK
jgi:NTE family protein